MIVTVTMNPAIDRTEYIDKVVMDPGGKGINVSKALKALGQDSIATGFLGGKSGQWITEQLEQQQIVCDFVRVAGETRTNTKIVDSMGITMEQNEPGEPISQEELDMLTRKIEDYCNRDTMIILSGSLPKGLAADTYRKLIVQCKRKGAAVFLDTSGEALWQGIQASPDYIKPNEQEFYDLLMRYEKENNDDIQNCACTPEEQKMLFAKVLLKKGIKTLIISKGELGADYITAKGRLAYHVPEVEVLSTVGAGDAMVAGYALKKHSGASEKEAQLFSLAASVGAVTTEGTKPASLEKTVDVLALCTHIMI